MQANVLALVALAVAAASMGSLTEIASAQNSTSEHPAIPGVAPPSLSGPGWGPEQQAGEPAQTTPPPDLPVLYVTSVEVMRSSAEPELDIVRVTGLASSDGWSVPQLVPTYAGKPFDGILDLELVATPPEQSEVASGFVPVSAVLALQPDHGLAGVRVRGSENAITIKSTPGENHLAVNVNDCSGCVGKKFTSEGTGGQPQQAVVRQQDLPKLLRIIKVNDGVRGIEHNPNRLSLILGEDDTILEAFWE
jgi:hypothetical protein